MRDAKVGRQAYQFVGNQDVEPKHERFAAEDPVRVVTDGSRIVLAWWYVWLVALDGENLIIVHHTPRLVCGG